MAKLLRLCQPAKLIGRIRVVENFIIQMGQLTMVSEYFFIETSKSTLEPP